MRRLPGVTTAPTTAAFAMGDGPGETAAPTTAAFATGERPGETAAATTAVLAIGAPTTPTRPIRAGLSGISGSCRFERFIGLERGDDRLDGDTAVGDQLTAGAPRGGGEGGGPDVLIHEDARDASWIHGIRQIQDILGREEFSQL